MTVAAAWVDDLLGRYNALGVPRCGTADDAAAAAWLRREVAGMLPEAGLQGFGLERLVPGEAWIAVGAERIEGLPLFDAPATPAGGVAGRFGGMGDAAAAIGWRQVAAGAASLPGWPLALEREGAAHAALVFATGGADASLAPLNAPRFPERFGPPVLQVAGREAARLAGWAGSSARVVVEYGTERAKSANVMAALGGQGAALVVVTPRTSWWTSLAERGGGIAVWLHLARALGGLAGRGRPVRFLATGGHELGHLGLKHAFAAEPGLAGARLFLHLGANLGCAGDAGLSVAGSDAVLVAGMREALVAAGYPAAALTVASAGTANGEAHDIRARGGAYLSLIGRNPRFHEAEDRWPDNVDAGRVAVIGAAVAAVAMELAR